MAKPLAVFIKRGFVVELLRKRAQIVCSLNLVQQAQRHPSFAIWDTQVAGSQVHQGYLVTLVHQAIQRSRQAELCVQRFWAKDQDPLVRWIRWDRTMGVVSIWFTARPSRNRVLELVEDPNIEPVRGPRFY